MQRTGLCGCAVAILVLGLAGPAEAETQPGEPSPLNLSGDFRVRYEGNSGVEDGPERHRGVLRFRLGAKYRINDLLDVGARVVTGDPGNPRTSDVTMGDFVDDLEVSLDRAYMEMNRGSGFATAGKFKNPFTTTELVWDGDVNPVGIAGRVDLGLTRGLSSRATGMLMIVDEDGIGDDSTMWGVQLMLAQQQTGAWSVELGAAYWDYTISSLARADDSGDRRGNYTSPDGTAYLSDFDLADLTVALSLPGPAEAYPIRVVADYVKNLGAAVDEDEGFGVDVYVGRAWVQQHFELRYGFARCDTDAVLGAFSHDNLPIATNYRNHSLRVSYGLLRDTSLSLTWYSFSQLRDDPRVPGADRDAHRSRVRLDLMVRF